MTFMWDAVLYMYLSSTSSGQNVSGLSGKLALFGIDINHALPFVYQLNMIFVFIMKKIDFKAEDWV